MRPKLTIKLFSDKYDLNHSKAVPAISTQCLMREIRILWSTVSKAPKSIEITESTESVANKISLKTCAMMQHFCPDISGLFKNDNAPILK